jgi:threonyl-tRNA synthetase
MVDDTSERMNQKIRLAQLDKIPYMLVLGDKEVAAESVSIRLRTGEQSVMPFANFKAKILQNIASRAIEIKL